MTQPHLLPPVTHILARQPAPNFAEGLTTADRGQPDYARAMQQYETYMQALRDLGLAVTVLPPDPRFPDGHFVEDPLIIYRDLAFLCRSGAQARRGEGESLLPHLPELRVVRMEDESAFIDGGDVLFCVDRVLIGLSERTNPAGADALRAALQTVQPNLPVETVPFAGVLHLKSGITELAPRVLVRDPAMTTDTAFSWAQVISLPPAEGIAADVMPINDALVIAAGYPTLQQAAERHYDTVIALDMSEFQKMDGGLTCLSLRY